MISQLLIFLTTLACGGLLRGVYFLMRAVQRRTALLPVTVTLDFVFGALCFAPLLALAFFYNDGQVTLYMAAGELLGFSLTKLLF